MKDIIIIVFGDKSVGAEVKILRSHKLLWISSKNAAV